MATNETPEKLDDLVSLAEDAADGAHEIGLEIDLAQNNEERIRKDLRDLMGDPLYDPPAIGTQAPYVAAKAAKTAATAAEDLAEQKGRDFISTAIGVLKPKLGKQWNSAWNSAGFTNGSLAVPKDPLPTLLAIKGYLIANPSHENEPLDITAAFANAEAQAVSTARSLTNLRKTQLATKKNDRDGDLKKLYERIGGLRTELDQLLEDDDPRWYAFGYARPADGEGPGPIKTLTVTPGGTGILILTWTRALRGEDYRVFVKILGTDPEPVQVASGVEGLTFTLTGLLSGETAEVSVVPVNGAGDGRESPVVTAVVP